jgi:predicted permease
MLEAIRRIAARIRAAVDHDKQDRERADEIEVHLALAEERLVRRGMTPEAARRAARIEFGGVTQLTEAHRRTRGLPILETLERDVRSAARSLRAAPGFTTVVLGVLTLAMVATTAIFSVDAVVLKGLPFDDGDRIVSVGMTRSGTRMDGPFSAPDFLALQASQDVFSGIAATAAGDVPLLRDGSVDPETLRGQQVSAEFFSVLRVAPHLGRAFDTRDEVTARGRVAVISHGLWQRRFGGSSDVIGKALPAADGALEIIGVMPPRFSYPVGELAPTEVWRPYVIPDGERFARIRSNLRLIARLKDGVSIEDAQARLDHLTASIGAGVPNGMLKWQPSLMSLSDSLIGDTREWMLLLLAAVTCVLVIACVNIANLQLVRASTRVRELRVRTALGATRWDLARMVLVESLMLSVMGMSLGLLVCWWGTGALQSLLPDYVPRVADIAIDWRVLAMAGLAAVATGIAFGSAPVWHCARDFAKPFGINPGVETATRRSQRLRTAFLVTEVALAVVLVVGAVFFLTSFARLMRVDLGLDYRRVLVVDVRPRDGTADRLTSVLENIRQIPGIDGAALATANLPFSRRRSTNPDDVGLSQISPEYFQVLGVPLHKGRLFTDSDAVDRVAVLNEAAAKVYFPNQEAIGRTVSGSRIVIGIVGNVRAFGPEGRVEPDEFVPAAEKGFRQATFILKTNTDDPAIADRVKSAIWAEFPDVIIPTPRTLEQALAGFIAKRRANMVLLSVFGILGLVIAAVGVYGVMTYIVTQRTREIGIRMALGANRSAVRLQVLRRAGIHVAVGLMAGLTMSWLLATSVQSFLFHVEAHDTRLFVAAAGVLVLTALFAAYLPARRASHVDPLVALRME